jgi:DNA-binding NtrC family response regulator
VRIIAASNKDLEQATKNGSFREDLFYRLNVIPLHLPPLRARADDIPLLIAHFTQEYCRKRNRDPFSIAPAARECLLRYQWPGNVRELENLIERLSILAAGRVVGIADLPEKIQQMANGAVRHGQPTSASPGQPLFDVDIFAGLGESGIDLNSIVSTMERQLITKALERSGGVRSKAAQLLGLNRTTLLEKMKKMKIERGKS